MGGWGRVYKWTQRVTSTSVPATPHTYSILEECRVVLYYLNSKAYLMRIHLGSEIASNLPSYLPTYLSIQEQTSVENDKTMVGN